MQAKYLRNALVLGLITAIGPFAIDMYLPVLPELGADLNADPATVQLSLISFFSALAVCQLIYGPVSDMVGRKKPLYVALALYIGATIGCALAPDIHWLIAFRFIQGVGACAGTVIPRAVVRDLHSGTEAARLMALLMLVMSVSPILAPLGGSMVLSFGNWRTIFWVIAGLGVAALILMATSLRETRPPEKRTESSLTSALSGYMTLLRDRHFLGLCMIGGFGMSSFMTYLSNSSFVLIGHYGLTPTLYSLFFSVNAVSFIGATQVNASLVSRFGLWPVVRIAVFGYALTMGALTALFAVGVDSLAVMAVMLFIGYGCLGMVLPSTAVMALDAHGPIAGTASALMGTLQFVTAGCMIGVVSFFADGTPLPMVASIGFCAVTAFALTRLTLGGQDTPRQSSAAE